MTLLVLTCSTSWCQSKQDSVLVSIEAIKIANAKMVELSYEKEINRNLRDCIQNDSILISALSTNLSACEINKDKEVAEIKKQRNITIVAGGTTSLLFLLLFIIAL